jgi:peptidoglycan/LPS O-acetylase OafA/YrhL
LLLVFNHVQVSSQCGSYWWADLLFVNNLLDYTPDAPTSCMPWTWFLSLDMQLFLLAPLITWLYFRWPRLGACVITLGIIACLSVNAVLSYVHDLSPNVIWGGELWSWLLPNEVYRSCNWFSQAIGTRITFPMCLSSPGQELHHTW